MKNYLRVVVVGLALGLLFAALLGCATVSIPKGDDMSTVSVLVKMANKCPLSEDMRLVTLLPKDPAKTKYYLGFYTFAEDGKAGYGFAWYGACGYTVVECFNGECALDQSGMGIRIDEKKSQDAWKAWVDNFNKEFDINKTKCGMVPPPSNELPI